MTPVWRLRRRRDSGGLQADTLHLHISREPPARLAMFEEAGGLLSGCRSSVRSAAALSPENRGIVGRVGEAFGQPSPVNAASSMKQNTGDEQTCDCCSSAAVKAAPPPPAPTERVVFVLASLLLHNLFEASLLSQTLELDQWIKLVQN